MDLTGIKSACPQVWAPSVGVLGDSVSLPLPASRGCLCSSTHGSFSPFPKLAMAHLAFLMMPSVLFWAFRLPAPHLRTLRSHWAAQLPQDDLPIINTTIRGHYFLCNHNSPLSCDIPYSQDLICSLDLGEHSTQRWTGGGMGRCETWVSSKFVRCFYGAWWDRECPKNRVSKATVDFGRICSTEGEWETRLQWVECNAT